ncbi:AT-rich interactive domain-containing protein 2 [Amborella trichopoda]|uniref:ELM2 domain-containing protein n=1 Tax=Amborella trichopoda TaxID=13333 RepID=W1PPI3_AMBTC|nr:AT-rich interactive domain-containing protein 2 [Amborella trichopoda]XP_020525204.1 AT-rich interactive domain-containing protein 2 [Amborella trichopoda]ERN09684.1 hypothetical protein AMTR_s00029p00213380 [Amborella trichopoda]|eukprot:XP_006848103.1 AT-rich interactive domain-containing protein 2 [Amborella trichopoda]
MAGWSIWDHGAVPVSGKRFRGPIQEHRENPETRINFTGLFNHILHSCSERQRPPISGFHGNESFPSQNGYVNTIYEIESGVLGHLTPDIGNPFPFSSETKHGSSSNAGALNPFSSERKLESPLDNYLSNPCSSEINCESLMKTRSSGRKREAQLSSDSPNPFSSERNQESTLNLIHWLRKVAENPCDPSSDQKQGWYGELLAQNLRAREALFLNIQNASCVEEYPYQKKAAKSSRRAIPPSTRSQRDYLSQPSSLLSSTKPDQPNQSVQRSQRLMTYLKINSDKPRKRVPVDPFFQADVPEWTEPSRKRARSTNEQNTLDDSRWLGTRVWPIEGLNLTIDQGLIGKGRPDRCSCTQPGSVQCARVHVAESRQRLRSELGPAFDKWGFNDMGEEVAMNWTLKDEQSFTSLVRLNPISKKKRFWMPLVMRFYDKTKESLVSYYFNVFVLRRMSFQTRMAYGKVDSDDDEGGVRDLQRAILSESYVQRGVP